MAKRNKKRKVARDADASVVSLRGDVPARSIFATVLSRAGLPLLLGVVTFLAYWPSLKSGIVYDARFELTGEGFITSLANLPAVLSLKVLGMHLILADRPGQLLYLMLGAAVWGVNPWGFHLASNLLHAANAVLLLVVLRRLIVRESKDLTSAEKLKIQLALLAVTLIFALHPIVVEPVSAINYSSDLLVTFFTLLALLTATFFRSEIPRTAMAANFVEAHYDLGNALLQKGETEQAILEYQKALQLKPALAPAECNLGTAVLRLGRKDEVIAHYRKALAIDPSFTDAQTNLGNILDQASPSETNSK